MAASPPGFSGPSLLATAALVLVASACGEDRAVREAERDAAREAAVRALADALNDRDWAALDTLLTGDYTRHSQATPAANVNSREDFVEFLREDAAAFPDARIDLEKLVAEGDQVAFWGTYSGTQEGPTGVFPATGERMELDFAGIHRFREGRIAETWVTWDNLAALVQLGHWEVTPPSERPDPDAFCAVWVPARAPAVDDTAGAADPSGPP
ncbi:MAG: ester cyclase [Gemmatimonadota bacterium]|nr:ester cyclase [Gemmatimonadota bacterium]